MAELKFDAADQERVIQVERAVEDRIKRFRENTEVALVCFGLARCIRRLLQNYPDVTRRVMREIISDFIEEKQETRHVETPKRIFDLNN